jgi:hypothetical protein
MHEACTRQNVFAGYVKNVPCTCGATRSVLELLPERMCWGFGLQNWQCKFSPWSVQSRLHLRVHHGLDWWRLFAANLSFCNSLGRHSH